MKSFRKYIYWCSVYCLAVLVPLSLYAQDTAEEETAKKRKGPGFFLRKFTPTDSTELLVTPRLKFRHINGESYYYNSKELKHIANLRESKQWGKMLVALQAYVEQFGIENFKRDMNLIWHLARLAEHEGEMALAKDVWKVLIKHHRGTSQQSMKYQKPYKPKDWMDVQSKGLQEALMHYDSIAVMEQDLYVSLEYYYDLVERRRMVDTLHPPESILLNMGEGVNSSFEDYGLTISGVRDDMVLFTSNRSLDTLAINKDLYGNDSENIYYAEKDEDGYWGVAQPFEDINTQYKEGSPCMNDAGDEIIFARCFSPDGLGNCDLYRAVKLETEEGIRWSEAENLGENVNSTLWDSHPSLSVTEDTLYFASDRPGGFGGSDIYFSVKDKKGRWGKAQNIGPTINTQSSEVSPHVHPAHNVLFFSSNGHMLNFGDFDIFKTYLVKGEWAEPKNIGPLVNGKGSEIYFAIDSNADDLFYSKSHPDNIRNLDLYSFPLPMEAQPNAVLRFSGKLVEPATGEVFTGVVSIIDLDTHIEVAPKYVKKDGSFEFDLIPGKRYLLLIEGDNFFQIEELFQDDEVPVAKKGLEPPEVSRVVTFESIDFDQGSSELKPDMENNLHLVIDFLLENPSFNCRVIGHTDSDGDPASNLALSKERAEAIRQYIESYGRFETERTESMGLGDTKPVIEPEVTEADKKKNRRVEFEIYKRK